MCLGHWYMSVNTFHSVWLKEATERKQKVDCDYHKTKKGCYSFFPTVFKLNKLSVL